MEYYSAIKRNAFESVLMRWMKLEPIIQKEKSERKVFCIHYTAHYFYSVEVSQKEKYKYHILTHVCGN